jgi:hypothetical protein
VRHLKDRVQRIVGEIALRAAALPTDQADGFQLAQQVIAAAIDVEASVRRRIDISAADFSPLIPPDAPSVPIKIPVAQWPGLLAVADDELPCYVLEDGRRVITRTGALNFLTNGKGGGNLESYLKLQALQPFLPNDIEDQFIDISIP